MKYSTRPNDNYEKLDLFSYTSTIRIRLITQTLYQELYIRIASVHVCNNMNVWKFHRNIEDPSLMLDLGNGNFGQLANSIV